MNLPEARAETGLNGHTAAVLIVTDNSRFKRQVIEKLFEYSEGMDIDYTVKEIKTISALDSGEYDRYIFLCRMIGGGVEKEAFGLYQDLDTNRVFIGLTCFFNMPMPEKAKQDIGEIDAVTAPSKKANIEKMALEIFTWVAIP